MLTENPSSLKLRTGKQKRNRPTLVYHPPAGGLFLEVEFFENRVVAALVVRLQIFQMSAAVCNHLQKSAAAVLVFEVFLKVARKLVNALAQ